MRIFAFFLLSFTLLLTSTIASAQSWSAQPNMKLKRSEAQTIDYKGELYVFNGFSQGLHVGTSIEKYNPQSRQWTLLGNTSVSNGTGVTHTSAVLIGDDVWLMGGRLGSHPGKVSNLVWIYNIPKRSWRAGPKLPTPMAAGGAALINEKIYIFGGVDTQAKCDVDLHFVYDLRQSNRGWKNITGSGAMPSARNHFSTVVIDDLIYAIGGQHGHDGCPGARGGNDNLVHSFNPKTNSWVKLANLPKVQSHNEPSTFVHNGFIYTAGGNNGGDDILRYDPSNNSWKQVGKLPEPLLAPVARIYNGRLIVAGGGAPITAKSIPKVRSIALNLFSDTAASFTNPTNDATDNSNSGTTTGSTTETNTVASVVSEDDKAIAVEAESFTARTGTSTHQWVSSSLPSASGGDSMTTTPNSGAISSTANGSPMLSYNIMFQESGTYYLWIRGWGDETATGEGKNDSLHAGLNGVISKSADKIEGFPNGWNWSKRTRDGSPAELIIPSAGTHLVNIWMREDGLAVDKFILTKNADFVPQGLGFAEKPTSTEAEIAEIAEIAENIMPSVNAGNSSTTRVHTNHSLQGNVSDDGLPNGQLSSLWSTVSGPGNVDFSNPASLTTNANFSIAGNYILQLSATDGSLSSTDTVSVTVQVEIDNTATPTEVTNTTDNGVISIDSENYYKKTSGNNIGWINASYPDFSGSGAMVTTPNRGAIKHSATDSPMLAYSVNFEESGTYYVWIRGWGDEGSNGQGTDDSVHAGINGALSPSSDKIDGFPAGWNWSNRTRDRLPATINVPNSGTHTFNIWMREDGFALDKIILTKNANFTPVGLGSDENQLNVPIAEITNAAPTVSAGADASTTLNTSVNLQGTAKDADTPTSSLNLTWSKVSGPGNVSFSNENRATTSASFTGQGVYVLKLVATDGSLTTSDTVRVVVSATPTEETIVENAATTITVEAEDFFVRSETSSHRWVPSNLNGASGSGSMITTPNTATLKRNSADSPTLSYPINFTETGVYYLWVRGWGDESANGAGSNDSVHAGLNGKLSISADNIDGFPTGWHWSKSTRDGQAATLTVPTADIHTVNFWMREDGFAIDKFIVTKDASFVPEGTGVAVTIGTEINTGTDTDNSSTTTESGDTQTTSTTILKANANRAWEMVQTVNGSSVAARHEAGAVAINNNTFYVLGGRGKRPVQSFSESSNKWASHGNAPVTMHHFQPVAIGSKVYVIGALGDDNYPTEKPLQRIYVFDTKNHTWKQGASIPQNRLRGSAGAAVHNNKIYLVGGNTLGHSGPSVNWFDEYNPTTDQWRTMPNAPNARDHATVAIADGKLVVAAGRRTAYPNVFGDTEAKTDVFNFATGRWETNAANIPTKRAGTMAVSVGDEVLIIGGEALGSSSAHRDVEALNVNTGKWRKLQPLLEGRHSGGATVLGNKVHVITGNTTIGGGNESINHETLRLDGS